MAKSQKPERGSSSVGRAAASQAAGRGFEPRLPLKILKNSDLQPENRCFFFVIGTETGQNEALYRNILVVNL